MGLSRKAISKKGYEKDGRYFLKYQITLLSFILLCIVVTAGCSSDDLPEGMWRSALYPADWEPDYADDEGRFLHDFSYAGYYKGEKPIPEDPPGETYNVLEFGADPTGDNDSTEAIQAALDQAGADGGGVVYVPEGTYSVRPSGSRDCSLCIRQSGVVLRGAGTDVTFIRNDETNMRGKKVIAVRPVLGGNWDKAVGPKVLLAEDALMPTREIALESVSGFEVGDKVVLNNMATEDFIADHGMTGHWNGTLLGPMFFRNIEAIDEEKGTITIDIPTRYPLQTRDHANVYRVDPPIEEVGIEHLSIGMRQNETSGWGDQDYGKSGTGAYQVHGSKLVYFHHALNSWMNEVSSYRPPENKDDVHSLSDGVEIFRSRSITIKNTTMQNPQYLGGGGNGYGYVIAGNDNLIIGSKTVGARHGFDFKSMWSSGNVIYDSSSHQPRLASDFHMHLSMANLIDNVTLEGDYFEAKYRPHGTILHGHSTTQSVFWNTNGLAYMKGKSYIVESKQFGHGYVIGTRGPAADVETAVPADDLSAPEDFVEGVGEGDTLYPQSLYVDQLKRRGFQVQE